MGRGNKEAGVLCGVEGDNPMTWDNGGTDKGS